MASSRSAHLLVFLALNIVACNDRPPTPPLADPRTVHARVERLAGCWLFESRSRRSRYLPGPLIVRFDTTMRGSSSHLLHLAVDTSLAASVRMGYWAVPRDTTRLIAFWGNGYTGLYSQLSIRADTVRGRGYQTSDFKAPLPRVWIRVKGWQVPCPSHPLWPD